MNGVSSASIHPTAVVASEIPAETTIGPYAIVEEGVRLGRGCVIAAHAILRKGAILGNEVKVDSFSVVGGLPQDIKFDPNTPSYAEVGDKTILREGVTIHRSTKEGGYTRVGKECFLMANAHVAHDCVLGNRIAVANAVLLGGHVQVGDYAFLGGGSGFHQFVRVGQSAMVGGHALATHDVPPYVMLAGQNDAFAGLNLVGLKRRGFSVEIISEIKRLYKAVIFKGGDPLGNAAAALAEGLAKTPEGLHFLEFFRESKRGFIRSKSKNEL